MNREPESTNESSKHEHSDEQLIPTTDTDAHSQEQEARDLRELENLAFGYIWPDKDDHRNRVTRPDNDANVETFIEKGTLIAVTIGITYSGGPPVTRNQEPIPQWGIGLFFDGQYIPLKFKEYYTNNSGALYRPELRFFSQEDAKAYALSIAGKFRFKLDTNVFGVQTIPDAPLDPIAQALEFARDAGVLLCNLHQDLKGNWRANVREERYYDFADGKTVTEAIEKATYNALTKSQLSYQTYKRKRKE